MKYMFFCSIIKAFPLQVIFCISSVFEGELAETIPVIHTDIGGIRIIGRMIVGKTFLKKNLVVTEMYTLPDNYV